MSIIIKKNFFEFISKNEQFRKMSLVLISVIYPYRQSQFSYGHSFISKNNNSLFVRSVWIRYVDT